MQFLEQQSLRKLNTLGFEHWAEYFCAPESIDAVQEALRHARQQQWPVWVLGGGSNIVLSRDIPGLTLHPRHSRITATPMIETADNAAMSTARTRSQSSDATRGDSRPSPASTPAPSEDGFASTQHSLRGSTRVTCDAGVVWHRLVRQTLDWGLCGLENLSLIPGCVGAAPIQNIGAYGVELKDSFESLRAIDINSGELVTFTLADCAFGYRDSVFKQAARGRYVIVDVTLRLHHAGELNTDYAALANELARAGISEPTARDVSDAVCRVRRSKLPDPDTLGNAGSFFKNPLLCGPELEKFRESFPDAPLYEQPDGAAKTSAGWLIERCGWKGFKRGGVGVYPLQALVLTHDGSSDSRALLQLADDIRHSVHDRFGVALEAEPVTI